MKRLICLICLVLPTIASAGPAAPLLDIYQDEPEVQEEFTISDLGDREELHLTSNGFLLPRQEFGRYVRQPTDFPGQVEKLQDSLAGTGFKPPAERTIAWPNWHVLIKGEEIDPRDPRFGAAFRLLSEQIKSGGWRRKDVTVATLKPRTWQLTLSRLQYPDGNSKLLRPLIARQALNAFEVCRNVVADHLVCDVPHGFIYLNKQANSKN